MKRWGRGRGRESKNVIMEAGEAGQRGKKWSAAFQPRLNIWLLVDCRSIWLFNSIQTDLLFRLVSALGKWQTNLPKRTKPCTYVRRGRLIKSTPPLFFPEFSFSFPFFHALFISLIYLFFFIALLLPLVLLFVTVVQNGVRYFLPLCL